MSYEKDKELMQKIHDLIDDYNYLNKVIPIVTETYLKERVNFYIEAYQDYKDILDYQLYLINDLFNLNLENPINLQEVKTIINSILRFEVLFLKNDFYDFNYNFRNQFIQLDKKLKYDITELNNSLSLNIKSLGSIVDELSTTKANDEDIIKFKLLNLNLLTNYQEITKIKGLNLSQIEDEQLIFILEKINKLYSLDFFYDFTYKYCDFLNFFNNDFFNLIKNNLYKENTIEIYKFKNKNLIQLMKINFEKDYKTYFIDNFFIKNWSCKNETLNNFKDYIKNEFEENFKELEIYKNRFNDKNLILSNDYLFLFFFDNFENFNFTFLLYILNNLDTENLLNYFNELPQKYKDLFNENLVSKFDKENEVNFFRKLHLNNKLVQNIENTNKKEKTNKI